MFNRIKDLTGGDIGPRAEQLKGDALHAAAEARKRFAQGQDFIRDFTTREPAKAVGLALGMGVLLGWLIKRR